jgi:hypothetical protein
VNEYTLHAAEGTIATVSFDTETHTLVCCGEIVGVRAAMRQLLTVLLLAEREPDVSDSLAFECAAARAILAEHLPNVNIPGPPDGM